MVRLVGHPHLLPDRVPEPPGRDARLGDGLRQLPAQRPLDPLRAGAASRPPGLTTTTKRRIGALLLVTETLVVLLIVRNYLYVTAWRLYLDGDAAQATGAAAGQRFDVERARVVPQILTPDDERLRFAVRVDRPSTLRFEARPATRASYEIALVRGIERRVVARGDVDRAVAVSRALPRFDGVIEMSNRGAMSWADVRVVRDFRLGPHLVLLAGLAWLPFALPRPAPRFS